MKKTVMKKTITTILSFAFMATLPSCHSTKQVCEDMRGKVWNITEASGISTHGAMKQPTITFSPDGRYNGNASVNSFFGTYKLEGSRLTLSEAGMTRMMGPTMDIEDAIVKALGATAEIKVLGDSAIVLNPSGETVMKLRRDK